jgi:hypothetical protein
MAESVRSFYCLLNRLLMKNECNSELTGRQRLILEGAAVVRQPD